MKLLVVIFLASLTCASTKYDHYLLSCGAPSGVSTAESGWDGQTWYSDDNSTFSDDFSTTIAARTTNATAPFSRARIFTSRFTYNFPVSPGPKFIRLLFYRSPELDLGNALINVQYNSGEFLLFNLSVVFTSEDYFQKEFYVHIIDSLLQLTFFPTSVSSHAFINGIEVVSVPDNLYVGSFQPENVFNPRYGLQLDNSTTLETAYRVNVGGREISSGEDNSGSMYRRWVSDDPYLIRDCKGITGISTISPIKYTPRTPIYSALEIVYRTFRSMGTMSDDDFKLRMNLTWGFEVDLGFYYLVRLHWCEVVAEINAANYRVFAVYTADLLAESDIDVFEMVGGDTPVFRDYVVKMADGDITTTRRGLLKLAMHPNLDSHPRYIDVLLNGLEIFKINNFNYNHNKAADFVGPLVAAKRRKLIIGCAIGGTIVLSSLAACVFVFRRMIATKGTKGSAMSTDVACHRFSLAQIKLATNDFNEERIIGYGGFGNVYRTMLNGKKVAIKRLNLSSKQGAHEFKTEIEMLSKIRHFHLVSLIGYCDESGEMILVYDYMEHGTLRDHLYNTNNIPLSWNLRLSVCLGAAKGLHYLHAGVGQMIIHRDVKSTNILLDENWVPKVSDFGLSKLGPIGGDLHVSTGVKGSFGYMDPEYYMLHQLTEKSDVYSFGVVLFEVLCGRAAVDSTLPWEQVSLAMWARGFQQRGQIEEIVDPNIKDEVASACLRRFGEIAERCVREHRTQRPTMADVVFSLESALKLQRQSDLLSNGNIVDDNGVPILLSQSTSFGEHQSSLSSTTVVSNSLGEVPEMKDENEEIDHTLKVGL